MKKIAIFASGSGSNFQAIVDYFKQENINIDICLLVCDRPHAKVIERAKKEGIASFVFSAQDYIDKQAFEKEILKNLTRLKVDLIVLAGYMRLIGETLLEAYQDQIINLHPSLLPSFPGKDAINQAFDANVKVTGVTIHYVDEGMDTGPIIAQEPVRIDNDDTTETLTERIHKVEHQLYPKVIKDLLIEE
ncbi:phosphoribosylglycinamide formyltransferase [Bacillus carboniphilus]|uniref:Phosphoribosylglycinamide formyltransferase n=1 Tax=Bacillus carboniphilus TaxID=86663 RepID=A0ABY9JS62_9BACI|nr:phosphoribosylglycinamide formyltransferase [Bacillus carboniphilus]WLR42246.1 phosphoribosylglycinamide formyltransferase [Bacillus carboniphilus]